MQPCVYCQNPLAPGERVCQRCGQVQPAVEMDQPTIAGGASGSSPAFYEQPTQAGAQPVLPPPPPPPGAGGWGMAGQSASTMPEAPPVGGGWQGGGVPQAPIQPTWQPPLPYQPGGTGPQDGWAQPPSQYQGGSGFQGSSPAFGAQNTWNPGGYPGQPGGTGPQGSAPMMAAPNAWAPPYQPGSAPQAPVYPGQSGIQPPKPGNNRTLKIVAILVAVLVVLGGSGAAFFLLTRPNPTLSVTTQSGSPDGSFHITGQNFTANSQITLMLENNQPPPDAPGSLTGDGSGNFSVNLPITDNWTFGSHTLTAKDAKGYVTKTGLALKVIPAPVLTVESQYKANGTPAGANGTMFTITGKRFSPNSAITLLVDNAPLQGASSITSDARGVIQFSLTVSGSLGQGSHTLTAKDAQGYTTKTGQAIAIVAPGVAHTPGPHGAPPDDDNFTISLNIRAQDSSGSFTFTDTLTVTGRPDPNGGMACNAKYDDGQPHQFNGTFTNGGSFTETITFACQGTYKSGHLSYVEKAVSDVIKDSNNVTCTVQGAYVFEALDGIYSDAHTISGTYRSDPSVATCTDGGRVTRTVSQGTFTGNS